MKILVHPLNSDNARMPRGAKADTDLADRLSASFAMLCGVRNDFALLFYARLFELYPGLRTMFPTDIAKQAVKLTDTLQWVVDHLRAGDEVRDKLAELGQKHVQYGALPEHYPIVRDVLIQSMKRALEEFWSAELESDWHTAIDQISRLMLANVAPPSTPKA